MLHIRTTVHKDCNPTENPTDKEAHWLAFAKIPYYHNVFIVVQMAHHGDQARTLGPQNANREFEDRYCLSHVYNPTKAFKSSS